MATLTEDQKKKLLHEDCYSALKTLRELKQQKIDANATIAAQKSPIVGDILESEWNGYSMADAMTRIGLDREAFRTVVSMLDIVEGANKKIPVLKSFLAGKVSELTEPDYINEINAEIA